jgi:hypothetical protein
MASKLTQKEADMLISMLKKTVEKEIAFPESKGRVEFDVIGSRRDDIFAINVARKGINDAGASYQGRTRKSGNILMRLDVNPTGTHENPDGEKVRGTHLHVYTEEHDMGLAIPFDVESKELYAICYIFFEKFNIIEPPSVTQQTMLAGV